MNTHINGPAGYWLDCLLNANELRLPAFSGETHPMKIMVEVPVSKNELLSIKEIAGNSDLNVLKLFIGGLGILLWKYTEQSEVVIAMPPMALPDVDVDRCGTLYCKLDLQEDLAVHSFFAQVHESVSNAYINSEYDEAVFMESYTLRRAGNTQPLTGAAFNYHALNVQGAWLKNHKLLFELIEEDDAALLRVTAVDAALPRELLLNMAEGLLMLVLNFPANKKSHIGACNLVPEHKMASWQQRFDNNVRAYPKDVTVIDLFLQQVTDNPHKTAVINGSRSLTYAELDQLSQRISSYIAARSLNPRNLLIGVMMDRSCMLVAVVVGILRAGAAYIPFDKDYPEERVRDILLDSGCPVIFTDSTDVLPDIEECEFVQVDAIPAIMDAPALSPPLPADLAYIMYSSGTTGRPKGIMIEHAAIMNLLFWYNERYAINEDTRIIQLTNIVIDIAFQEIFSALINGLTLYVPLKEESQDKQLFIDYLNRNKINFIQMIPDTLFEYLADTPRLEYLDLILCGGDKLNDSLKDIITAKGYNLYNVYGQTETAIDTVGAVCRNGIPMRFNEFVPNYDMLIADSYGNLCPEFLPGEIWTGGTGLARGYLSQPALTTKKFIEHPLRKGQKIYRTGDMARRLPDGSIELLGRKDDQVKMRGFRIEPGEIENALESYNGIDKAVVVALTRGEEKDLVAYIVSGAVLNIPDIRLYLAKFLPAYMVPQHFVQLDKLPLTSSGKIDRKALPQPEVKQAENYVAPSNSTEKKLVEIWSDVLKLDPSVIGINSNFFEMGGHSLKAARIIAAIEKEFNVKIQLVTFFMKPTIRELEESILVVSLAKKVKSGVTKITI